MPLFDEFFKEILGIGLLFACFAIFISSANEGGGGQDLLIFFLTGGFFSEVDEELLCEKSKIIKIGAILDPVLAVFKF